MAITIQGLVPKLEATEKSEYCKEYGVLRNNMPGKKQAKRLGDVRFQCGRVLGAFFGLYLVNLRRNPTKPQRISATCYHSR